MSLYWVEGTEGFLDDRELWDFLQRHRFVDGAWAIAPHDQRRRVEELARELGEELSAFIASRAEIECAACHRKLNVCEPPGDWKLSDEGWLCPAHGST